MLIRDAHHVTLISVGTKRYSLVSPQLRAVSGQTERHSSLLGERLVLAGGGTRPSLFACHVNPARLKRFLFSWAHASCWYADRGVA